MASGGGRDATNKGDFFDVDTGNPAAKNGAISISDTIAVLVYIGTNSAHPAAANLNGRTYGGDDNNDGTTNGETFDRSPGASNGTVFLTGAPNGAVSIADAISSLNQIGANCSLL